MWARTTIAALLAFVLASALSHSPAVAQENANGPAPALEFPFAARPEAEKAVSMAFLRFGIEKAADFALCKILMTHDGKVSPPDAQGNETCLPEYAAKVKNNEGFVQWADNARPLKCSTCFGRPFTNNERAIGRPNLRRVTLFGRLVFKSVTGPNRSITFPYQTHFTCSAANGARQGNLLVDVRFDRAIIGDPGFWESFVSFFTVGELSRQIDSRIKRELSPLGSVRLPQGPCRSVGVDLGNDPITDNVRFDPALPPRPGIIAISGDNATIQLLRIKRNPLPVGVSPDHARPGAVEAGQFTLFSNGAMRILPPAGLSLPPEGGSVPLNFCRSISLAGANRLQLLFINDLGGAVWSEFQRPTKFGDGPTRTMTTGRTIVVPARPGTPGARPLPVTLREFELTYRVSFNPKPQTSRQTAALKPSRLFVAADKKDKKPCVAL